VDDQRRSAGGLEAAARLTNGPTGAILTPFDPRAIRRPALGGTLIARLGGVAERAGAWAPGAGSQTEMRGPMQAPESRIFSFRSEFHQAVTDVLVRSRIGIAMADYDFSDWPLESPEIVAALSRILREPGSGMRVVVQSPDWLERHSARFASLRATFADRVACRQPPPGIAPGEGLLLGDRMHLLRRAHYESFRGRVQLAMPEQADPWRHKFEMLWQESTPCLAAKTLGL
jgi:hypothetical protein